MSTIVRSTRSNYPSGLVKLTSPIVRQYAMQQIDFSGKDILIAENGHHAVTQLRDILRSAKARQIYEARDTAAALSLTRKFPLHAILITLKMHPIDGIDFIKLVRNIEDDAIRQTPIVMIASTTKANDITKARDAGVDEVVAQPLCAKTLLDRMQLIFDHPRKFVNQKNYIGPERRLSRSEGNWNHEERRNSRNETVERAMV